MFFGSRKKKKLAEEARKEKERLIQEETAQKARELADAHRENLATFYRICDMVRSLPKKRQIVVVQRENIFFSEEDRNWAYLQLAKRMKSHYQRTGLKWMCDFGENNDALYAFYEPKELNAQFRIALNKFSEEGFRIQRIRYYSQNL